MWPTSYFKKKNIIIIPILHPQSSQSTLPDLSHKLDHQLIVETSHQGAVPLHNLSQLCDDKTIKLSVTILYNVCQPRGNKNLERRSHLLSVGLNKSRPVKLGIFPEIFELRNTNHFRTDKNLTIKGKRWEEKK